MVLLDIHPEIGAGAEVPRQAQCGVGGDSTALVDDLADAGDRHVQFQGKAGDAWGPCTIFAGKQVNANGWCQVYVKKT